MWIGCQTHTDHSLLGNKLASPEFPSRASRICLRLIEEHEKAKRSWECQCLCKYIILNLHIASQIRRVKFTSLQEYQGSLYPAETNFQYEDTKMSNQGTKSYFLHSFVLTVMTIHLLVLQNLSFANLWKTANRNYPQEVQLIRTYLLLQK